MSDGIAPTIETARLLLRPWGDSDVASWVAMCADERVMEFFPATVERDVALAQAERLRARLDREGYGWWVAERKGGPAFAGLIQLQEVPFEASFTPALEVGWRFVPDQWGQGLATEGARAALEFAFTHLDCDEVVAMTAALNLRSQRVMQRLRMTRDAAADFEHPFIEPGHRIRPHVLYRLTRAAFRSEAPPYPMRPGERERLVDDALVGRKLPAGEQER